MSETRSGLDIQEIDRLKGLLARAEASAQRRERAAFEAGFCATRKWDEEHQRPSALYTYEPADWEEAQDANQAFLMWRLDVIGKGVNETFKTGMEP